MHVELIKRLICPHCSKELKLVDVLDDAREIISNGIVQCKCSRFPITAGILNLGGFGQVGKKEAVRYMKLKKAGFALRAQLEVEIFANNWPAKLIRKLHRMNRPSIHRLISRYRAKYAKNLSLSTNFVESIKSLNAGEFGIYFLNRFTHPSLVAAIPIIILISTFKGKTVLDYGSGAGHAAFLFNCIHPEAKLTCLDKYFINLLLSKNFMAPKADYICTNFDYPLPFSDRFDAVFSLDVLHYLKKKEISRDECLRVLKSTGILALCHLHNSLVPNVVAGNPLKPDQWSNLFRKIPHFILSEDKILRDFLKKSMFDLTQASAQMDLNKVNALTLIGSKSREINRQYLENLISIYSNKKIGKWAINPLYRCEELKNGYSQCVLSWPSERFAEECWQLDDILEESIKLPENYISEINFNAIKIGDIYELVKNLILIKHPNLFY